YLNPDLSKKEEMPLADLSRVVIALQYAGSMHGIVLLEGKVDAKLLEKQGRAAAAKANDKTTTVQTLGKPACPVFRRKVDVKMWGELIAPLANVPAVLRKLVAPSEIWYAALDERTVILSLAGKAEIVRALRARPKDSKPRTADEMTALLRKHSDKDIG